MRAMPTAARLKSLAACVISCLVAYLSTYLSAGSVAAADRYPARPIRLVVPTGAGGNTDVFARIVAEKLRAPLGQQIIVDNRPGADGRTRAVNRAPACGM